MAPARDLLGHWRHLYILPVCEPRRCEREHRGGHRECEHDDGGAKHHAQKERNASALMGGNSSLSLAVPGFYDDPNSAAGIICCGRPWPFPPTEPANKEALVKAARDAIEVEAAERKAAKPAPKSAAKPAPKKAPPAKAAPKKKKLTARERTKQRMTKGKRVTQKLKRRSKQLFQVSMWMLLVAAFVAGFLYIRRRWAETPSIIPLEDVFGAPFNKHVELEVTVDDKQVGQLRFELLDQVATETAQAFSDRCTGGAHDGNEFYRIVPGFVMQGGDDSEDRVDLTVKPFKRGLLRHDRRGLLVMVRAGPYQMTSQFFITLKDAPMLDGRHVVFGALAGGVDVLEAIEAQGDAEGAPLKPVRIASCKVVESAGGTSPLFPPAENYGRVEL